MRRLMCLIGTSCMWSAPWLSAQSSNVAILKSGTTCYRRAESGIRCFKNGLAEWFGRNFAPTLRLIDGKGPTDFGLKGWSCPRCSEPSDRLGGFKDGFKVPLTVGKHTLTMAFHASATYITSRSVSTNSVTSANVSVSFAALAGHFYKLDVLTNNDPYWNLGSGAKWQPVIVDATDN